MGELRTEANSIAFDSSHSKARTLWLSYQPIIVPHTGQLIGLEALLRDEAHPDSCPTDFLEAVRQADRMEALGSAIRTSIAADLPALPDQVAVYVNLEPEDLQGEALFAFDEPLAPYADRIVLELTERTKMSNVDELGQRVAELRSRNFRVALDDLGAGHNGLAVLTEIELDIVKLDMALVRNVDRFRAKQILVRFLIEFCHENNMQCLAEGIESQSEHDWLIQQTIDLAQGFYYGRALPVDETPSTFARPYHRRTG
ncbi:MAG: EAL domain-containing protein (putative c-di-GMP-specific phosphodiesterase class I) [Planctomycetota bacterium]